MESLPAAGTGEGGADTKPAAAPAPASSSYGRVLVQACRDVFKYSSVVYGSK